MNHLRYAKNARLSSIDEKSSPCGCGIAQSWGVPFDQGEFNFDAMLPGDGFRRWREQLEAGQRAFERRWGVTLGCRVVLMLRGHAKPLTGVVRIVSDAPPSDGRPPELEIRGVRFFPEEVESLIRAEENEAR